MDFSWYLHENFIRIVCMNFILNLLKIFKWISIRISYETSMRISYETSVRISYETSTRCSSILNWYDFIPARSCIWLVLTSRSSKLAKLTKLCLITVEGNISSLEYAGSSFYILFQAALMLTHIWIIWKFKLFMNVVTFIIIKINLNITIHKIDD